MKSYRKQEQIIGFTVTPAFLIGMFTAIYLQHLPLFLGFLIGYGVFLISMMALSPFRLPKGERHGDPCPWDRKAIQRASKVGSLVGIAPELVPIETKDEHHLWHTQHQGRFGTWTLTAEEFKNRIVAYSLVYRDSRTTSLDRGSARSTYRSAFFHHGSCVHSQVLSARNRSAQRMRLPS